MPTFSQKLREHYEAHPQQVALVLQHAGQPDRAIRYGELLEGASGYAGSLAAAGIQPGEVVVLILQHGADLVFAFYGAVLHGAIPSIMPYLTEKLLPERYRSDLATLVSVTQPAAIITYREFEPEVQAALQGPAAAGPDPLAASRSQAASEASSPAAESATGPTSESAISPVRAVLVSDGILPPGVPDWDKLGGMRRDPADIVLLQHSSGTTGLQKGVALSHQAIFNQLSAYAEALRLRPDDIIVSWLPLYHDMGLIAGFLMPILSGIQLVIMSPFDWVRAPVRLLQAVSKYKGTLSWLPNFAYNFCAQKIRGRDLAGIDLSSWRAISNCSEPMRFESHQAFFERFAALGLRHETLATCYAMAENVFAVTQGGIDGPVVVDAVDREAMQVERLARPAAPERPSIAMLSAGRPVRGTEVKVVSEQGATLPERTVGELALRSDCMLTGYYHRPDATAKAFRDGWYLTGDYGYMAAGEVYVAGRKKDLIIVGGKNVYPLDIEILAMQAPGVHAGRVSAFGVYNEEAGTEDVVVVAEVDATGEEEKEQIARSIEQAVSRGSAINLSDVFIVNPPWIVKTSSGKTARLANKEKYLKERDA